MQVYICLYIDEYCLIGYKNFYGAFFDGGHMNGAQALNAGGKICLPGGGALWDTSKPDKWKNKVKKQTLETIMRYENDPQYKIVSKNAKKEFEEETGVKLEDVAYLGDLTHTMGWNAPKIKYFDYHGNVLVAGTDNSREVAFACFYARHKSRSIWDSRIDHNIRLALQLKQKRLKNRRINQVRLEQGVPVYKMLRSGYKNTRLASQALSNRYSDNIQDEELKTVAWMHYEDLLDDENDNQFVQERTNMPYEENTNGPKPRNKKDNEYWKKPIDWYAACIQVFRDQILYTQ